MIILMASVGGSNAKVAASPLPKSSDALLRGPVYGN
jgi:hypothetical protein